MFPESSVTGTGKSEPIPSILICGNIFDLFVSYVIQEVVLKHRVSLVHFNGREK